MKVKYLNEKCRVPPNSVCVWYSNLKRIKNKVECSDMIICMIKSLNHKIDVFWILSTTFTILTQQNFTVNVLPHFGLIDDILSWPDKEWSQFCITIQMDFNKLDFFYSSWKVDVAGPKETLFEGENFQLSFQFNGKYPFDSPIVTFTGDSIPMHPHVYRLFFMRSTHD